MFIKKLNELKHNHNDIYIVETYKNDIIINENYNALLLLNLSLNIIQKISLPNNTTIYFIYKKYDESKIILYSPDDDQITFIDMHTMNSFVISLPNELKNYILSPNYYWQDNILIFATYDNIFYQFLLESLLFTTITPETIKKLYPIYFDFWNICKKYNTVKIFPDQQCFIFQENTKSIIFFDYKENKKVTTNNFTNNWHDIEYKNNTFIFVHEKKIELLINNQKLILQPQVDYIFLKAKFLKENTFVLLSSKPSNPQESLLETYELIK